MNCASLDIKNGFPITCPVAVQLAITPPDKRKRDLDNYIKPELDVLEASGAVENDSMVKRLSVYWTEQDKAQSGVLCTINKCSSP